MEAAGESGPVVSLEQTPKPLLKDEGSISYIGSPLDVVYRKNVFIFSVIRYHSVLHNNGPVGNF